MKVLLVGGDSDGQVVEMETEDLRNAPRDGYRTPDWWALPDPTLTWDPPAPVPRVAVSFAADSPHPTMADIWEMSAPQVPEGMHTALQAAWAKAIRAATVIDVRQDLA